MEIRQLRYFACTFESGSITRAAAELSIVQSALSLQLNQLEKELGVRLLVRSSRGIVPTAAGQVFYQYVRAILRQLEQARTATRQNIHPLPLVGAVTIGLAPTTASAIALELLRSFRTKHPGVVLHIIEDTAHNLENMLLARKVDLAILFSSKLPDNIESIELTREHMYLVEKKRGSIKFNGRITLEKAMARPLILPSRLSGRRRLIDAAILKHKIHPDIVAEVDSFHTVLSAVADGMAASIQPWSAVMHVKNGLMLTEISAPEVDRPNYLCSMVSDLLSPVISMARELVMEEVMQLVSSDGWKASKPK